MSYNRREYHSSLAYHLALLFASFVVLPRSRGVGGGVDVQITSSDRPEHPLLTPLTSRPLNTVAWHVVGELVIMLMWGQHLVTWLGAKRSDVKQERVAQNWKRLKGAASVTAAAVPMFAVLFWILGGPLDLRTLVLAVHAAVLIAWAPAHAIGLDRFKGTRLFSAFNPETPAEKILVYPVIGALAGGWAGAVLIALDWDRPWQSYPLTPAFGMLVGYAAGHVMH